VTNEWKVKLGDFGEAIDVKRDATTRSHRANSGGDEKVRVAEGNDLRKASREEAEEEGRKMTILGTIAYMAPELVEGKRRYTESIDVYALTVTLWQIWTGREPYEGIETFSLYQLIASGTHPPLPDNSPDGFNDILAAGWATNSQQRISSKDLLDLVDTLVTKYISELYGLPVTAPASAHLLTNPSLSVCSSLSSVAGENDAMDTLEENNPLTVHVHNTVVPHETLEMLGFSSVFDDGPDTSESTEDYYHLHPHLPRPHNPLKLLKGWSHHSPLPKLPKSKDSPSQTRVGVVSLFSTTAEGEDEDDSPQEEEEEERKVNEMDLYQSYARHSITEPKQNPILSLFNPAKFQRVW
jgi:serine/threonine protein kinase